MPIRAVRAATALSRTCGSATGTAGCRLRKYMVLGTLVMFVAMIAIYS